jgi:hypothetical protein
LITEEERVRINAKQDGETCQDAEATEAVAGKKPQKQSLKSNPFFAEFKHGANDVEGWTCNHMVSQMEGFMDVLKVLHPEFQHLFLFDHSCGHDRQKEDGLNHCKVNKHCGGSSDCFVLCRLSCKMRS